MRFSTSAGVPIGSTSWMIFGDELAPFQTVDDQPTVVGVVGERPEDVTRRQMKDPADLAQQLALRPFTNARRAEQQNSRVKLVRHRSSFARQTRRCPGAATL